MKAKQRYFKFMLEYIFRFVLDQAIIAKVLDPQKDLSFRIILPEISAKDFRSLADAGSRIVQFLAIAKENNWIGDDEARRILSTILGQLDIELSPELPEESEEEEEIYEQSLSSFRKAFKLLTEH